MVKVSDSVPVWIYQVRIAQPGEDLTWVQLKLDGRYTTDGKTYIGWMSARLIQYDLALYPGI